MTVGVGVGIGIGIALFSGDPRSDIIMILWTFGGRERDAAIDMISNQVIEILVEHSLHAAHIAVPASFFTVVIP